MNIPRIRLREHSVEDMERFCELQMDPDVARYVLWLPRTREQCEAALLDAIDQQKAVDRVRYFFAVTLANTDEMIGSIGYTMTGSAAADCGWFLRRRFWKMGYALEAVRSMVCLALRDGRLTCLNASCLLENRSSIRVAESCGFRRVRQTEERVYFEIRINAAASAGGVSSTLDA